MASVLERRTLTISVKMKLWFWGAVDVLFLKSNMLFGVYAGVISTVLPAS